MGICQSKEVEQAVAAPVQQAVKKTATKPTPPRAAPPQAAPPRAAPRPPPESFKSSANLTDKENTIIRYILNFTDSKPLDANEVSSLVNAKKEIELIRKIAAEFLATVDLEDDDQNDKDERLDKGVRGALYDKQDFASFQKVTYEKDDATRSLIYDAIKPNVLFENDTKEEVLQIIDVFKPQQFSRGESVITQGDDGDKFYVLESGKLDIRVTVKGEGEGAEESEITVGDYKPGAAFGELALIFGSPRAATIVATADCKLWSLERNTYRSVISQVRYEMYMEKKGFLQACVFSSDRPFKDIFDSSQIDDLTIASKVDHYEAGAILLREGQMGDTFYIVKSGEISYYKEGEEETSGIIDQRKAFGTTSLYTGVVSSYTYQAKGPVSVFYLTRHDFESIMGPMKQVLDGQTVSRKIVKAESRRTLKTSMALGERYELDLDELTTFNVLGRGAFGEVSLVQSNKSRKVFALKAQSKDYIAKKGQQVKILNEYRIMKEMENINILGIHCAMQDDKYLYFLLDLLPGGELMKYLTKPDRGGKGFSEDTTRFYAASIVLAFEQLHPLMIAYRDLKPENIVLNKDGYGVLVDFGLAKEIDDGPTYSFCGTPDYLAPEVIRGTGHDWGVDYWGLGIFLFEMTSGTAPFYATNYARRTRKIMKGVEFVRMPSHFSNKLSDLISQLLNNDQSKRLGRTQNGIQGIKNHRWFAGFDWEGFEKRSLKAPIQPQIPEDIKTLGTKKTDAAHPFKAATHAPPSDWWPDLKNIEAW